MNCEQRRGALPRACGGHSEAHAGRSTIKEMNYEPHNRIPMQYLIIDAEQNDDFVHSERHGGAAVGCWIKNQTEENAYLIAKGIIEKNGWKVLRLDEQYPISEEDYDNKSAGREYFELALIDEEVFVFHTFPENEQGEPGGGEERR